MRRKPTREPKLVLEKNEEIAQKPEVLVVEEAVLSIVEEELKSLHFGKFEFRDGLNVTVRRGTKWSEARGAHLAIGPEEDDQRLIMIHDTLVMPFTETASWIILNFEHDPNCHNFYQLFEEMKRCYPAATPTTQGGFSMNDEVTAVFFTVVES